MLYVSVDQQKAADNIEEFKEFLELDLENVHGAINLANSDEEVNMMLWEVIHRATQEDGTLLRLMDHIRCRMPDYGLELDKSRREYHRFHHDLHKVDGVLCYRDHIWSKVLIGIHASQGMAGRIDEIVFWPGNNPDIIRTRGGCMT